MNEFKPQLAHWNLAPYGAAASYDEGSEVKAEDEEKYDNASGMTLVRLYLLSCGDANEHHRLKKQQQNANLRRRYINQTSLTIE